MSSIHPTIKFTIGIERKIQSVSLTRTIFDKKIEMSNPFSFIKISISLTGVEFRSTRITNKSLLLLFTGFAPRDLFLNTIINMKKLTKFVMNKYFKE